MGTTLENGVYLPSEGERNCYAGLKTNWEILDQKVADITALQQAVAGALHREIVESLPTTDIDPNTIYMVLSGTSATENVYNEFMYVNNAWELIGTSATDLTNYYTKADVDGKLLLKANDSDVVHKSGSETVGGNKIFTGVNEILRSGGDHKLKITDTRVTPLDPTGSITSNITWQDSTGRLLGTVANVYDSSGNSIMQLYARSFNANDESESHRLRIISNKGGNSYVDVDVDFVCSTDNIRSLGTPSIRWKDVYSVNYYYGSNNVEFSTKFVTTDTAQTISGNKTFSSNVNVYNSDSTANTPNLYLRNSKIELSSQGNTSGDQNLTYFDKNNTTYAYVKGAIQSNGAAVRIRSIAKDSSDNSVINELQILAYTNGNKAVFPLYSNEVDLGVSSYKWKSFNGLEPSSLSLPSDRSARIDISGYFTNTGSGYTNDYIVPANGYIFLNLTNVRAVTCYSLDSQSITNFAQSYQRSDDGQIYAFFPVRKNDKFRTLWYSTGGTVTVTNAYFIPCQGNV